MINKIVAKFEETFMEEVDGLGVLNEKGVKLAGVAFAIAIVIVALIQ